MRRLGKTIGVFVYLRLLEYVFAVVALTATIYLFGEPMEDAAPASGSFLVDLWNGISVFAGFAAIYMLLMFYGVFSLLVFLAVEFSKGLSASRLPAVNALPYAVHSLPIMLGFGGEGAVGTALWAAWAAIVAFNFRSPRFLPARLAAKGL